jgi:outer membrane biogenesis lipoprotein LolB
MKRSFVLLTLLVLGACSTTVSKRDLASEKEHQDKAHEAHAGQFDRSIY